MRQPRYSAAISTWTAHALTYAAVEHVGTTYKPGTTKTRETRSVPVPPPVLTSLRDRIDGWARDRLVFPCADGYLKNHEFRKVFNPVATRAGVAGLSPHELRPTCASLAIQSRASIKTVQQLLGHKTATMTLDNYGHLYPEELDQVAAQMGAACVYGLPPDGLSASA